MSNLMPLCDCLSQIGYSSGETYRASAAATAASLKMATAIAQALLNASTAIDNFRKQRDIAKRAVKIAEEQQAQIQQVFWPRELQFLAEYTTPETLETIEAMGKRYAGRLVSAVANKYASEMHKLRCSASRYCTSAKKHNVQALLMAKAQAMSSARVLGRNIAFAEWMARNDVNNARRMQAIGLGRGYMNQATALLGAAAEGLAHTGTRAIQGLNSAMQAFGGSLAAYTEASNRRDMADAGLLRMPYGLAQQGNVNYSTQFTGVGAGVGYNWSANDVGMNATYKDMTTMHYGTTQLQSGFESAMTAGLESSLVNMSNTQFSNVAGAQNQHNVNPGTRMHYDLARFGKAEFPVLAGNVVIVDMDKFRLDDATPFAMGDRTMTMI